MPQRFLPTLLSFVFTQQSSAHRFNAHTYTGISRSETPHRSPSRQWVHFGAGRPLLPHGYPTGTLPCTHTTTYPLTHPPIYRQVGGDIEDIDGHTCVVCPAHRYRIDIATGHKVDRDLCGNSCTSQDQKQRVYQVHCDDEFIWAQLPDLSSSSPSPRPLPSDYYNQVSSTGSSGRSDDDNKNSNTLSSTSNSRGYGLFGSVAVPPQPPLQPYAGRDGWAMAPPLQQQQHQENSADDVSMPVDEPQLMLSQPAAEEEDQKQQQQHQQQPQPVPSLMNYFPSTRTADPPHIARRKAATAAILNRSYRPPTVDVSASSSSSWSAPTVPSSLRHQQQQQQQSSATPASLARTKSSGGSGGGGVRQATLFESWNRRSSPSTATAASMDMS